MSLASLLDEIRADLRTMPTLTRMYDSVPDALNEFPAVIVASMGGRCWLADHSSNLQCEHDIRIEIHVPQKGLEKAAGDITAIAGEATTYIYRGFATDRFNGTMVVTGNPRVANNATSPLDYTIGASNWAAQETYAMMMDFKVTTEEGVLP